MEKFEVIASPDFKNGGSRGFGIMTLTHKTESFPALFGTTSPAVYNYRISTDVVTVEQQTEESIRKLSGAAGWGIAGALLAGPVGLLLGALWGGRKKERVCFSATLTDGKMFLAVAESKIYQQFVAATFSK